MSFKEAYDRCTEKYKTVYIGIDPTCVSCQFDFGMEEAELADGVENDTIIDEGSISSRGCDTCGSSPQQLLYNAHALDKDEKTHHLMVCEDCVLYIENGQLPKHWEA